MKYFIITCLLIFSEFTAHVVASGRLDPYDPGDGEYPLIHNGVSYIVKYPLLELYKHERILATEDYPAHPGFKLITVGVPQLEAGAIDILGWNALRFRSHHISTAKLGPKKAWSCSFC